VVRHIYMSLGFKRLNKLLFFFTTNLVLIYKLFSDTVLVALYEANYY